jgi:hypothetical protein
VSPILGGVGSLKWLDCVEVDEYRVCRERKKTIKVLFDDGGSYVLIQYDRSLLGEKNVQQ